MRAPALARMIGLLAACCVSTHGQAGTPLETAQEGPAHAGIPRQPLPSGPYGIGRAGYDWTDTSRPDRYAQKQARRELMVYVWYPTLVKHGDDIGVYLPGAKQMNATPAIQRAMREDYQSNWPLIVSGAIFSHAVENAAIAKSPKELPVVVLSHGLGGSGFGYTALIEDLVSHGYVVVAIEHTETAGAVCFPDGRLVPFHQDPPTPGLTPQGRWKQMMQSVSAGIEEGAADVRFVLAQLMELNAGKAQSAFAGRLDFNRVVAMGHSAGAEFAARACELDARFKACVDLDGGMAPVAALPEYPDGATVKSPLLFLEAYHSESHMGGTHLQHLEYFKKREEQLAKCTAGTYAVVLRSAGMSHGSFSDDPYLEAGDSTDKIDQAHHNFNLIVSYIRGFLGQTLDHDKSPLFDADHAHQAEAEVVPYGH